MNFVHAFFAVGAVVGPLGAGLLLHNGLPWQLVFGMGAAGDAMAAASASEMAQ